MSEFSLFVSLNLTAVIYQLTYRQLNQDEWKVEPDAELASILFERFRAYKTIDLPLKSPNLCTHCLATNLSAFELSMGDRNSLQSRASRCPLCRLLLDKLPIAADPGGDQIIMTRNFRDPNLMLGHERVLKLSQWPVQYRGNPAQNIQIGLPRLLPPGHGFHLALLQGWLSECDERHSACRPASYGSSSSPDQLPTRVLDVGTEASDHIVLVNPRGLTPPNEIFKYVALSYAWGDKTRHQRYLLTTDNQQTLRSGVTVRSLPRTFRDAITVTRGIGVRYLWIDALCIVQEGRDSDFPTEAERMEVVFSNAYCVLAASRATGTADGFLGARVPQTVVVVPQRGANDVYASAPIDDFQADVIDGPLNKRGWVLQERALARRTIFFTATQTYWQCGEGVRCETLTKMTNTQAAFLGDPNFPKVAEDGSRGAHIALFQLLYSSYSTLQFSNITDCPFAIAGLETRLGKAFHHRAGFGVFEKYLHRSILWRRAAGPLTRIDFSAKVQAAAGIPSWSWMSYEGAIGYLDIPYGDVSWELQDFRSPWTSLPSHLATSGVGHSARMKSHTRIVITVRDYYCSAPTQEELIFDRAYEEECQQLSRCVVIGRLKTSSPDMSPDQRHYVLIVRLVPGTSLYHRVGVGYLTRRSIRFDRPEEPAIMC